MQFDMENKIPARPFAEVNFARTRVLITLEASNPIAEANSISSITSI